VNQAHPQRTIRLVIGYQGTRYEGWQSQRKDRTVQELLEKALARILKEKTNLHGSSRTDSGVHALGLVAHFKTHSLLPDMTLKKAINYYLPPDVLVRSAKTVAPEFHARYLAKGKLYRYDIWNSPTRPLFEAPFVLWHPSPLDVGRMRRAARVLIGKHDFSAFKDQGDEKTTYVRTLRRFTIRKKGPLVRIEVIGDGFLRHMVRILVGTLLEVGRKKLSPEDVSAILRSKDRSQAGPTAKPHGLTLVKVFY
jgi:tRNA pseudouridine38-40 synthase